MSLIILTPFDLAITSALILLMAFLSWHLHLGVGRQFLIAALRSAVQLILLGYVLKIIFTEQAFWMVLLLGSIMLSVAGYEVLSRQRRRFIGWWGYGIGAAAMSISSFSVTLIALLVVIQPTPWYQPQYAIPLLGMLLGNTMTGIAVGLDNLTRSAWEKRELIEAQLILGRRGIEAIRTIRRDALRSGMIPIINTMAAAGLVSLPGMMTGQILAGVEPLEAAKYQLLIMYLIAGGTGLGSLAAIWIASERLFDERHRLRLDRLSTRN